MKKIICGLTALAFTLPALADKGFYGQLALGNMNHHISGTSTGTVEGVTETDAGGTDLGSDTGIGFVLGYKLLPYLAVEVGHIDGGKGVDTFDPFVEPSGEVARHEFEASALTAGIKGLYSITPSLALYGKLGLANWDIERRGTDSSDPTYDYNFSDSGSDVYWGLGVNYAISHTYSVGLEYSSLTMSWSDNETIGVDSHHSNFDYRIRGFSLVSQISF